MPNRKKQGKRPNKRGEGGMLGARGRMSYNTIVRVTAVANLASSITSAGHTGIAAYGPGSATSITPFANGTNYVSLSPFADNRCTRIRIHLLPVSATNLTQNVQFVAAVDSTAADLAGGAAANAFVTIMSRQTAKYGSIASQLKPTVLSFRPVELQDRLWNEQKNNNVLATLMNWGVLLALTSITNSITVSCFIEWWFDVREPQVTGVLLGKPDPVEEARLNALQAERERVVRQCAEQNALNEQLRRARACADKFP